MTSIVFDDSDFESFSETSSEDKDDIFSVYGGQAQRTLSNLEDSIEKIDEFLSFEREYSHGNIVCAVTDPSGQMGQVVQVNIFVDVENVIGKVIRDISSSKLLRLQSFCVGDYVVYEPWLGRVDKVVDCISVVFDDGTKCEVMETDAVKLVTVSPNFLDDSHYPYHPGQRVKVGLSSISKSSGWLCGMSKKNQDEGTICSIEAGIVFVDWLASASGTVPSPSCTPNPKDLVILSSFPHSSCQLGEWCILPLSETSPETDNAYQVNLLKEEQTLESGLKRRNFPWKLEDMFVIRKKRTKVDVMWQDGTLSRGLDPCSVFPVAAVNAHDFFPEQLVLEKASWNDSMVVVNQRWGVVKTVDASEHTLKVEWRRMEENMSDKILGEETVSAYELICSQGFSFRFGDIVLLLEKHISFGQTDSPTLECVTMMEANHEVRDSDQDHAKGFLSSIGYVIGFKDGNVQVQWANGIITEVAPYKLARVDKDDGSIATHVFPVGSGGPNHGLVQQEIQSFHEEDSFDINHVGEEYFKYNGNTSFFWLPQAAIGIFSKFVTNIFRSPGSASVRQSISHSLITNEDEDANIHVQGVVESSNICVEVLPEVANGADDPVDVSSERKVEEILLNREITSVCCKKISERFEKFDIVSDCSDHYFVNSVGEGSSAVSQVRRGWLKKVQQEWSLLEQDLPGTIYVRIYEERIELIRAAIVGVAGTPYHDGLFFFDIFLSPDYPNEPPMVHYHSCGLRLNPNLYESGRVCLSLLNTWTGTGSEVWNPESSTILQVLLSLQALVLNDKPYFNEAGYDKQIGRMDGERNSVSYNENAFLVTCKSMLYLMRKPPKNFEVLVEEHFKGRCEQILLACKAYMEGNTPVGSFVVHEMKYRAENYRGNSTGFKIMLAKLFPKLTEALCGSMDD